ncbi:hypothetical protein AAIG39_10095 [Phytobacter palmae]|uniref:Uncharacterized protein n=1 Tax=Phytobacter palmae TaxID=1855371 RepID=A0ABU9V3X9_9ENTR
MLMSSVRQSAYIALRDMPEPESKDAVNKVGVLITMANEQPIQQCWRFIFG